MTDNTPAPQPDEAHAPVATREEVVRYQEAMRWIYEHGFKHSSQCPDFVNAAFDDAHAPTRALSTLLEGGR